VCMGFKSLLYGFLVKQQAQVKLNGTGACLASYRMTDVAVSKTKRWRRWSSSMQTRSSSTKYVCHEEPSASWELELEQGSEDAEAETDDTDSTPETE